MSLFDDMTIAVNRGTKTAPLKLKMADLDRQRRDLCAQLGESLFEVTKDRPEFREGREALFGHIEDLDRQRAEIESEIADVDAKAAAQKAAVAVAEQAQVQPVFVSQSASASQVAPAGSFMCPHCGSEILASDLFCSGCGMSAADAKEALASQDSPDVPAAGSGLTCASCGAQIGDGDLFCMECGARIERLAVSGEATPKADPQIAGDASADGGVSESEAETTGEDASDGAAPEADAGEATSGDASGAAVPAAPEIDDAEAAEGEAADAEEGDR